MPRDFDKDKPRTAATPPAGEEQPPQTQDQPAPSPPPAGPQDVVVTGRPLAAASPDVPPDFDHDRTVPGGVYKSGPGKNDPRVNAWGDLVNEKGEMIDGEGRPLPPAVVQERLMRRAGQ